MSVQQVEALTGSLKPVKENGFWESLDYYRTKIFYPENVLGEIRNFTNSKYPAARIIGGPILCNKKSGCREYKQLDMENTPPVEMNVNRLMFVGTSQTIGAGASELEKTFFSLLHERINKIQEAVSVNISQSALSPEEMLAMFSKNVDLFKPTHVLVNLGYNQATHSFTRVLAEFSAVSKKYNAKIIYISEANNLVETSDYIKELNQFIKQNSLPVIDLYSHLRSSQVNEDISIWWDPVHFNDRGQRLAADFLYEELVKLKLIRTRAH
ncbi:MAG: SGNH/GDSL hydrolase family protein [Bacteriovoracia bacterium]